MKVRIQFSEWTLFCRLAGEGSIAAAAKVLDADPSNLKRRLDALEEKLRLQLFVRGRNGLSMTVAGRNLYARVRPLVDETFRVLEAQRLPVETEETAKSYLLAIPAGLWRGSVERALRRLRERFPLVNANVFLYEGEEALPEGLKPDLTVAASEGAFEHARYLGEARTVICATPEYLEREGMITSPEDLARHAVLTVGVPARGRTVLVKDDERFPVKVFRQIAFPTIDAMTAGLLAGEGVALAMPEALFEEFVREERLVRLLPDRRALDAAYVVRVSESAENDRAVRHLVRLLENEWQREAENVQAAL